MNPLAQDRWNQFEQAMLNAMRQGMFMLGPRFQPAMVFVHDESRERDILLVPVNLPLYRVKVSIQARIDSTPDQRVIDQRETRQAGQAVVVRAATQAADKAETTVAELMSAIRRALPFIENNAANAQGRKMLVDILMQDSRRVEDEPMQ